MSNGTNTTLNSLYVKTDMQYLEKQVVEVKIFLGIHELRYAKKPVIQPLPVFREKIITEFNFYTILYEGTSQN